MARTVYDIQLKDLATNRAIIAAGGKVYVAAAGGTAKKVLLNPDSSYASLANPLTPTRGKIRFAIDSVSPQESSVDLFIMAPGGQFAVVRAVQAGNPTEIAIDLTRRDYLAIVPFDIADTTAATETDTGFDFPTGAFIQPDVAVWIAAIDATETIDVGLLSSESGGDANGFGALVPVGVLGALKTTAAGTPTKGALILASVTADAGAALIPEEHEIAAAVSLTYTLTTGSDTATGFIQIPYRLPTTT